MPERVEVVRAVGLWLTLAGVFLVAPSGTVHLVRRWYHRTTQALRSGRRRLASSWLGRTPLGRWLRAPSFRLSGVSASATGTLTLSGSATVKANWLPDSAPVEQRIEQLRGQLDSLRAAAGDLANAQAQRLDSLRALLDERTTELRERIGEVSERLDRALIEATEVDASALPWVLLGVLLQGWPGLLSWLPWWALLPVLAGVVARSVWLTLAAVRREHRRGKARVCR
jgi:hypothetical protein